MHCGILQDDDLLDKLHREFEAEQVQFDRDWLTKRSSVAVWMTSTTPLLVR